MTEPVTGGKVQESDVRRYQSTRGLDYESVPWRLWEKSKKLFWDPADLDFSRDAIDWQEMPEEEMDALLATPVSSHCLRHTMLCKPDASGSVQRKPR